MKTFSLSRYRLTQGPSSGRVFSSSPLSLISDNADDGGIFECPGRNHDCNR